jgi:hypothetical protein
MEATMAGEILTDDDIADLQALAVEFQPDTCDIIRLTETQDAGGTTVVETVIASGVSCHYSEQLTPQDLALAERHAINIDAKIDLPANQDITVADRVTITLWGAVIGSFEVTLVVRQSFEALRTAYVTGPL